MLKSMKTAFFNQHSVVFVQVSAVRLLQEESTYRVLIISSHVFEKRLIPLLLLRCTFKHSQLDSFHELHCSSPRGELPLLENAPL
jgi:hypothetical protein